MHSVAEPSTPEAVFHRAKELADRLENYADSITVFVALQVVAFTISLSSKDVRAGFVTVPWFVVYGFWTFIHFVEIVLVIGCHFGQDKLIGKPDTNSSVGQWAKMIRYGRLVLVLLSDMLMTAAILVIGIHNKA